MEKFNGRSKWKIGVAYRA
ncbi:Protein of unknown function [Bacillus mobilis]|nr:Protein of unknown function [Bacillus mobilis]